MDEAARRLLATMPLHAITATYGEEGLRERFALEIARFPDAGRRPLGRALGLGGRVATRIIAYYHVRDPDVVIAALLHDAVEDHPGELAPGGGRPEALAALAA